MHAFAIIDSFGKNRTRALNPMLQPVTILDFVGFRSGQLVSSKRPGLF